MMRINLINVRAVEEADGFERHPDSDEFVTEDDRDIYAVAEFAGVIIPITDYVDFYGDGGRTPDEVADEVFAEFVLGIAKTVFPDARRKNA